MKILKLLLIILSVKCPLLSCTSLIEKSAVTANLVFKDLVTSVVWWHDVKDNATEFMKLFEGCVIVAPFENNTSSNEIIQNFHKNQRFLQTIFFAAKISEVKHFLTLLYEVLVSPIRLLVILTEPTSTSDLKKLMEIAWNNDVADILVISSSVENVLLSTYIPYRDGKCGDCTPVNLANGTKELFPRKFKNFYGCEIRTSLLEMVPYAELEFENNTLVSVSGIDGNVLNLLLEVLNASMKIISIKDHGGLGTINNGTATGSFADLVEKRADVMLPALIMNSVRYPYVQFSHPHEVVAILWFGPRRRVLSDWLRLAQPFISTVTPTLFTTACVFIVATTLVRRFKQTSHSKDSVLFQSFIIFLGMESKFETKSRLSNYMFMSWIWFCMVVRIVFQGALVDRLQKTALESPFQKFETAVELVDGYGGIDTTQEYFSGTHYYNNYEVIPFKNITLYLEAIDAGKRYLVATDKEFGMHSAPEIQVMYDDPVTEGPGSCFYMRPGWPAVLEIDNLILRIIETGFVDKIYTEHSWEFENKMEVKENRDAKPLTLQSITGYFYGLVVMYGACILTLILEIVFNKINFKADPAYKVS